MNTHLFAQISYIYFDASQDNILISDGPRGVAQITDFGIARILDVQGYTTMTIRNVRYAAPELRPIDEEVDPRAVRPTPQSDIYSLGILLLQVHIYIGILTRRKANDIISHYSCSMGLTRISRESGHTIMFP